MNRSIVAKRLVAITLALAGTLTVACSQSTATATAPDPADKPESTARAKQELDDPGCNNPSAQDGSPAVGIWGIPTGLFQIPTCYNAGTTGVPVKYATPNAGCPDQAVYDLYAGYDQYVRCAPGNSCGSLRPEIEMQQMPTDQTFCEWYSVSIDIQTKYSVSDVFHSVVKTSAPFVWYPSTPGSTTDGRCAVGPWANPMASSINLDDFQYGLRVIGEVYFDAPNKGVNYSSGYGNSDQAQLTLAGLCIF